MLSVYFLRIFTLREQITAPVLEEVSLKQVLGGLERWDGSALAALLEGLVQFLAPTQWLSSYLSVTPVPGDPIPSSGLCRHYTRGVQTHPQAKHFYTSNKSSKSNNKTLFEPDNYYHLHQSSCDLLPRDTPEEEPVCSSL